MNKFLLPALSFLIVSFSSYSQTETSAENPINEKFSELIETSNTFKGYKVVDFEELTNLQRNTSTYIGELKEEISTTQESLNSQKEEIAALEARLDSINAELTQVEAEKDALVFLGMPFTKGTYKAIMWGIVGFLVLALVFFIYRFKKGNSTAIEAKKRLYETEKEFEAFRAKALEKEQRLGRMLQDERNKHSKKAI